MLEEDFYGIDRMCGPRTTDSASSSLEHDLGRIVEQTLYLPHVPQRGVTIVDGQLGPLSWCMCPCCIRDGKAVNGFDVRRRFIRAQRRARKAKRGWS